MRDMVSFRFETQTINRGDSILAYDQSDFNDPNPGSHVIHTLPHSVPHTSPFIIP